MPKDLSREQKNNNPENQRPTWQNPSILRLGGNSRTWEPRATSKTRSEFVAENRWVKNYFQCSLHPPPNPTIENFPTTQTAIMKLTKKQKIPPQKKTPPPRAFALRCTGWGRPNSCTSSSWSQCLSQKGGKWNGSKGIRSPWRWGIPYGATKGFSSKVQVERPQGRTVWRRISSGWLDDFPGFFVRWCPI